LLLHAFDIIGIIAFALSGYISGVKNNTDILGVFILAFVTAFAGGIIRDISTNNIPFVFSATYPIILVIITIIFGYLFKIHEKNIEDKTIYLIADTLGLISFSIAGALIAHKYNLGVSGYIFLSLITATGGGVVKDILLHKKPSLLNEDIYGTLAIIIGILIYSLGTSNIIIIPIFIIFFCIRIYIKLNNISLPKIT
jgi:uncharacterized membrane protein YeiH